MEEQKTDVKQANKELVAARVITNKRNKNTMMCVVFIVALSVILAASVYFMFFASSS